MNGLERTFQFLESTPNQASLEVLVPAVGSVQTEIRSRAIAALLKRESIRACRELIECWDDLEIEDRILLNNGGATFLHAVQQALQLQEEQPLLQAIDIAETLNLVGAAPQLIRKAEAAASHAVRRKASSAVLRMANEWGSAARRDHDQPVVRSPLMRALAKSVRRFDVHRNVAMVDAFLAVSKWSDSELCALMFQSQEAKPCLLERFRDSHDEGVAELLVDILHRRTLPSELEAILVGREDALFRDQLLDTVGLDPGATLRRNLAAMGIPKCCDAARDLMPHLTLRRQHSLAMLYAAIDQDSMRALQMLLDALDTADEAATIGLVHALNRCPELDADRVLRAAVMLATHSGIHRAGTGDGAQRPNQVWKPVVAPEYDPDAEIVGRLIRLLDRNDPLLATPVRSILKALRVEAVMPRLSDVRPITRRHVGSVVMKVDPNAVQTVRGQLRHPVMQRRLEAMLAAVALDVVDQLTKLLVHAALHDHLEARVHAAGALGHGRTEESLKTLRDLANGPDGPVCDAARKALKRREQGQ